MESEFKSRVDPEILEEIKKKLGDYPDWYYQEKAEWEASRVIVKGVVENTPVKQEKENAPVEKISSKNIPAGNYTKKPKELMKVKMGNRIMIGRRQDLLCLIFEFDKGSFFQSNSHLAKIFGVDKQSITNDISALRKAGYLDYQSFYDKTTGKTYKRTLRVSGEIRKMFEAMDV